MHILSSLSGKMTWVVEGSLADGYTIVTETEVVVILSPSILLSAIEKNI
jgi:hypothetical protein